MINHFVNSCLSLKTYPINKTELNELKVKSTIVISTYNKLIYYACLIWPGRPTATSTPKKKINPFKLKKNSKKIIKKKNIE